MEPSYFRTLPDNRLADVAQVLLDALERNIGVEHDVITSGAFIAPSLEECLRRKEARSLAAIQRANEIAGAK
jgi:hypothetical protein